jgi:TolA-binding protein
MKRFILAGLLLTLSAGPAFSQGIQAKDDPDQLFYLASDLYREKEYPGCFRTIETWFDKSENPLLLEEASYLRASVAYELNKREAALLMIRFIEDFPVSARLPKMYYKLGCTALNAEQYEDAIGFFKRCPESELSIPEITERRFRYAYASLQLKDYATARAYFSEIIQGENRYVPSATYFLAYMDYADGKIQSARDGFEKVSDQVQYKNVTNYFKLQLLYIDGRLDEVTSQAEAMLEQKPTPEQKMELVRLLGAAWFDKKKYALSQQYYLEYLAMNPVLHRSDRYRIGINYYTQRNFPAAINYLTQASGPEDALSQSSTYHVGLCYLKQGKKDQARMNFEQASHADFDKPTQEKALYNYAVLCYESSFSPFNEQVKAFQRILTEFPESQFSASVNNYLSEVFLSSKEYASSLATIDSMPNPDQKMLQTKSRLLFMLGMEQYKNQQFTEAQQLFTQSAALAMELTLPTTEIYYWKGESNYRLGLMKEAADDFKSFVQDPAASKLKAFSIAYYQLGYAYFNQSLYTEARTSFEKYTAQTGVKKEKTYTDALNRIGDCFYQAKDLTKAEKNYQTAELSSATGNDYATYQRAICLGARKQYKAKIDLLSNFEKRFPKSELLDNALFELGNTYLLQQRQDLATAAFSELLSVCGECPLSRKASLQLADLLIEQGKTDEAVAACKKVIELYPGSEEAQAALKGLKNIFVTTNTVTSYLNYTAGLRGVMKIETGEQDSLSFQVAENDQAAGNVEEAIKSYTSYLDKFPAGAFRNDSQYQLGRLLLSQHQTREGLVHLDSVANHTGNKYQVPAARLVAEGYFSAGDYAMALNSYEQLENMANDRSTKLLAGMGALRCSYLLELYKGAIDAANSLLDEKNPGTDMQREILYYRAMSELKDGQTENAKTDLETLSTDVQTAFGAEARFRLAECWFNEKQDKEAEKIIQEFTTEGSTQSYWLARCFILMADICIQRGNDVQAKQYLTSLKENYQAKNDVQDMISSRLNTIAQRSN